MTVPRHLPRKTPILVWAERDLEKIPSGARAVVIGSPFLYLERNLTENVNFYPADRRSANHTRTLVYPQHGPNDEIDRHQRMAKEVAEREDLESTKVVLHASEYTRPDVRRLYETVGLEVDCVWRLQRPLQWDPMLLVRHWLLMSTSTRLVSNSVSTGVWYGAHMGLDIAIYGASNVTTAANPSHSEWPYLFEDCADWDPDSTRQEAALQLGLGYLQAPSQLASNLGFDRPAASFVARALRLADRRWPLGIRKPRLQMRRSGR